MDMLKEEVLEASMRRLNSMNRESGVDVSESYAPDGCVESPSGRFRGRDEIREFWQPMTSLGPSVVTTGGPCEEEPKLARSTSLGAGKKVVARDTTVEALSEDTATVSQCLSMPGGSDVWTRGKWVRLGGQWLLSDDEVIQIDQYAE
mmetsp:Transcript_10366/g.20897  ORF Transcript_10366/g.20897 Transcript_10366/m.20897 type:complete len:147 (-) Transcript_10366:296-736(-)